MAAEPVPPVTDNERDAETLREIVLGTEAAANASEEVEAALTAWGVPLSEGRAALARLVAALSAATTEVSDMSAAAAAVPNEAEQA